MSQDTSAPEIAKQLPENCEAMYVRIGELVGERSERLFKITEMPADEYARARANGVAHGPAYVIIVNNIPMGIYNDDDLIVAVETIVSP